MSAIISTVQKSITEEVSRRIWNIEIRSELHTDYKIHIKSEVVTKVDGVPRLPTRRDGIQATAGAVAQGADGASPEDYPDADGGVPNNVTTFMSDVVSRGDALTYNNRTIPAADLPSFIALLADRIVAEAIVARRAEAIDKAIAQR